MHLAFLLLSLLSSVFGQTFHLKDRFVGHDFLSGFNWETFNDPTGGRVNYIDQATALSKNLSYGIITPPLLIKQNTD